MTGNGKTYICHSRRVRALRQQCGLINLREKRYGCIPLNNGPLGGNGKNCMPIPKLSEPIVLSDQDVDASVTSVSPGVYVLDKTKSGPWVNSYVGRSDVDLNARLKKWVGKYFHFRAAYMGSPLAAFEAECELFHAFNPTDNTAHPARPANSNWVCPRCYIFG